MASTLDLVYGSGYAWPAWPKSNSKAAIVNDAATEKMSNSTRISYAGDIAKIHIPLVAVGQAPVNGVKVSLQGRTFGGTFCTPDGTPTHYRVIPQADVILNSTVITGLITDDGTDTGAKKTVAVGDVLTAVAEFENWAAGDSVSYFYGTDFGERIPLSMGGSWCNYWVAAAWAAWTMTIGATWLLEYDDGTIKAFSGGTHVVGTSVGTVHSFTAASTPDEYGAKFVAPANGKISSICWWQNYAEDVLITVYASDDTVLGTATVVWDDDVGYKGPATAKVWFDTAIDMVAGDTYRVTHKPAAGTASFYSQTYSAAMAAEILGGSDFMLTQRTDAGAWTDTATKKPIYAIIYSEIDIDDTVTTTYNIVTSVKRTKRRH